MKATRLLVLASLFISVATFTSCNNDDDNTLSPARSLEGNWKTSFAVSFYYLSDYCTPGTLQRVAKTSRTVTWKITTASNVNEIDIEWNDTRSTASQLTNCTYYTPDISLKYFKGVISSSQVTLYSGSTVMGSFSFTTDNIAGDYKETYRALYSSGVETDSKALVLVKQ